MKTKWRRRKRKRRGNFFCMKNEERETFTNNDHTHTGETNYINRCR